MSWIVDLVKLKRDIQHLEDIETDDLIPLGTKAEVFSLLRKWFPDAKFNDLEWINLSPLQEATEIIISGANELADSDMIEAIGFRNPSLRLLRDVCNRMGWKAFNPSDGDFINFAAEPPEMFVPYFPRMRPQPESYSLVDFIVYLRDQVMETWIRSDKDDLRRIAATLETLKVGFEDAGYNSPYWVIVDKLAYFARHSELANYELYVPSEQEIRKYDSP